MDERHKGMGNMQASWFQLISLIRADKTQKAKLKRTGPLLQTRWGPWQPSKWSEGLVCIGPPHCQSVTITTLRSPPPPPLSINSMLSCYFNIFGHHTCALSVPFIIIIVVRSSLSSSALLFTLQFYTLLAHDFTFLSLLYHSVAVLSSLFPLGVLFMLILLWSRLHPFYKPYPSAASHFFPEKNDVEKIFVNWSHKCSLQNKSQTNREIYMVWYSQA